MTTGNGNGSLKKILLVEDNLDDIILTKMAIQKAGLNVEVIEAHDGTEALSLISNYAKNGDQTDDSIPDLVLLDLKLPKVDGHKVLEALRSNNYTKFIPTVVLTTSDEESDLEKASLLQANSYIQKPVDLNKFTTVIKMVGTYWLEYNLRPAYKRKNDKTN